MLRDEDIAITKDNAEECVKGYLAGKTAAIRLAKPSKRLPPSYPDKSEFYQFCYTVGYQDQRAKMAREKINFTPASFKVRDCATGFDAGRVRARKAMPMPAEFKDPFTRKDRSSSYILGYEIGYSLQWNNLLDSIKGKIELKRKQPEGEKTPKPRKKKPRLETQPATTTDLSISLSHLSDINIIEVISENPGDCVMGYFEGKKTAETCSSVLLERAFQRMEAKSDIFKSGFVQGYRDQFALMQNKESDGHLIAIHIRDCLLGFEQGRAEGRKKPIPESFKDPVTGFDRSISFTAGYDSGVAFIRMKIFDCAFHHFKPAQTLSDSQLLPVPAIIVSSEPPVFGRK